MAPINTYSLTPGNNLSEELTRTARSISDWLINEAIDAVEPAAIFEGFCERLFDAGIPVDRVLYVAEILHAEQRGYGRVWRPGEGSSYNALMLGSHADQLYAGSPFAWVHEHRKPISLCLAETPDDMFNVIPDLKEQEIVHYVCIPLFFATGAKNGLSLGTKHKDGFTQEHLALFEFLMPSFRAISELKSVDGRMHSALRTYVGNEPSEMILAGDIHRGHISRIRSAIMFVDMRNFTALSVEVPVEELVEVLNDYYDLVVPHIEAAGGEVLKFIGDGVLAVFRAQPGQGPEACQRVMDSVKAVLQSIDHYNVDPELHKGRSIHLGVALHFGNPAYGNVGSGTRLDFTVIGRDVNYTSRIADLCSSFDRRLLMSEDFVQRLPDDTYASFGAFELPGVPGKTPVYVPA